MLVSKLIHVSKSGPGVSEWLSWTAFLRHKGPYKLYIHNLDIEITVFPHIDNTQSTGHN